MEIGITVANYRCFSEKEPARFVLCDGLTAVVGANNTGKSTLLRFFWELRPLFTSLAAGAPGLAAAVGAYATFSPPTADVDQLFHDASAGDLVIVVELLGASTTAKTNTRIADRFTVTIPRGTNTYTVAMYSAGGLVPAVDHWVDGHPFDEEGQPLVDLAPMLRAIGALARIRMIGPRRAASSQATSYDFDGVTGSNLVSRWKSLKGGGRRGRDAAAEIEGRLGRLFNLDRLAITFSENGQDLFVSVGNQSYHIDELGSGLSHFLVALVTLNQHRDTSWVLVDEPDNGLHPTMQMEFLRTVAVDVSEGVLFATHNYGLARQCAARTYLVSRPPGSRVTLVSTPVHITSLAEFLGELGYSGYRDQGVDRLLLVEGPNDARVIDELRRVMQLAGDVLLLPLGGNDTINQGAERQLSELTRICPKVFAVIDSEKASEASALEVGRKAFVDSCGKLGIECHVLERRSTENYLSASAIRSVLGPKASALGSFERASGDIKTQQVKIAARMTAEEVAATDLGRFLSSVYELA